MKRYSVVMLFFILVGITLTGCIRQQDNTSQDIKATEDNSKVTSGSSIDVDLTKLSSTMVYSEVYNMVSNPDDYIGKIIKMKGSYYSSYSDNTEQHYHFVIIDDATACCQQGLEFIWSGTHKYPDDYPEEEEKIEITGIFSSYEELGETYYYVKTDNIKIVS